MQRGVGMESLTRCGNRYQTVRFLERSAAVNDNARSEQTAVIVGAGMAGGNTAVTLREEGWRGRIVLLGTEPGIPFGRPPLSKTYLRGEEDLSAWQVKPADWYGDHDVELRTGSTVRQVDTALKQVRLESGAAVDYDKLVLCTGGRNRRLAVLGASRCMHEDIAFSPSAAYTFSICCTAYQWKRKKKGVTMTVSYAHD